MYDFDEKISQFCKRLKIDEKYNVKYTRYADDMTFSGDFVPQTIIQEVESALLAKGLSLNKAKTKIMKASSRQIVTGCVVNEKLQLPKEERKKIRQSMYYIKKSGLTEHMVRNGITKRNYAKHLLGKITYASFLNPSDLEMKSYMHTLKQIIHDKDEKL